MIDGRNANAVILTISIQNLRRLNRIGGVPFVWECLRANGY